MIIIDQDAYTVLARKLEDIRTGSESIYGIHLRGAGRMPEQAEREEIIQAVRQHLSGVDIQIYLCKDGDIFILAPVLERKASKALALDITACLGKPATDEWVRFLELPWSTGAVLVDIEAKIERDRKLADEKRRHEEQQRAERKRQSILNHGAVAPPEDIQRRRAGRKIPELMIIEDDMFSRKLVESIVRKRYALTGLGEADAALHTYARLAPDLLFLDINLPDVTGHELLERIIALDPNAYVVMLSGNADRENIMQAMHRGAKGFIAKPFTKDKLFQYIERCPSLALKQQRDSVN